MIRRMFLKLFGMGAAVPVAAPAEVTKDRDGNAVLIFSPRHHPRAIRQIGFSEDVLHRHGLDHTEASARKIDSLLKGQKKIPMDSIMEMAFPPHPVQDVFIIRWWHPSFQIVKGFDPICTEAGDLK